MFTYILGLLSRFAEWLSHILETKVWRCYFCKKHFTTDKPRINAFVKGNPIYQCEVCRLTHEKDRTRKDSPPEGIDI